MGVDGYSHTRRTAMLVGNFCKERESLEVPKFYFVGVT